MQHQQPLSDRIWSKYTDFVTKLVKEKQHDPLVADIVDHSRAQFRMSADHEQGLAQTIRIELEADLDARLENSKQFLEHRLRKLPIHHSIPGVSGGTRDVSFTRNASNKASKEAADARIVESLERLFGPDPTTPINAAVLDSAPDFPSTRAFLSSRLVAPPVYVFEDCEKTLCRMQRSAPDLFGNIRLVSGEFCASLKSLSRKLPRFGLIYCDFQCVAGSANLPALYHYLGHLGSKRKCLLVFTFCPRDQVHRETHCQAIEDKLEELGYVTQRHHDSPRTAGSMWQFYVAISPPPPLPRTRSQKRPATSDPPVEPSAPKVARVSTDPIEPAELPSLPPWSIEPTSPPPPPVEAPSSPLPPTRTTSSSSDPLLTFDNVLEHYGLTGTRDDTPLKLTDFDTPRCKRISAWLAENKVEIMNFLNDPSSVSTQLRDVIKTPTFRKHITFLKRFLKDHDLCLCSSRKFLTLPDHTDPVKRTIYWIGPTQPDTIQDDEHPPTLRHPKVRRSLKEHVPVNNFTTPIIRLIKSPAPIHSKGYHNQSFDLYSYTASTVDPAHPVLLDKEHLINLYELMESHGTYAHDHDTGALAAVRYVIKRMTSFLSEPYYVDTESIISGSHALRCLYVNRNLIDIPGYNNAFGILHSAQKNPTTEAEVLDFLHTLGLPHNIEIQLAYTVIDLCGTHSKTFGKDVPRILLQLSTHSPKGTQTRNTVRLSQVVDHLCKDGIPPTVPRKHIGIWLLKQMRGTTERPPKHSTLYHIAIKPHVARDWMYNFFLWEHGALKRVKRTWPKYKKVLIQEYM